MKTIVVGFDGSDASERALVRASEFATCFGARLVVLTAVEDTRTFAAEFAVAPSGPVVPAVIDPVPTTATLRLAPPKDDEPARRTLERARSVLTPRGIDAEYVSAVGDPVEAILQAADERDAELVVVGAVEHGFLERLLGLCVDEQLARKADRDVLLVRGDGGGDQ